MLFRSNTDAQAASLLFLTGMDDNMKEIAGWDYSAAEFEKIQTVARISNQTLAEFLHSAIEDRLNRNVMAFELNEAIDQVAALYELMEHQVFNPIEGEYTEAIKCGMIDLKAATFNRLRERAAKGGAK